MTDLQDQNRFHVHQKKTLMSNRYRVFLDEEGKPGELVALVEQSRSSIKDHVLIYTGVDKETVLAEFKARKFIDTKRTFDVFTPEGTELGFFHKDFGKSLYRSTWTLEPTDQSPIIVSERSKKLAIVRRLWNFLPLPGDIELPFPGRYHFDFTRGETVVGGVDKTARWSDHYLAHIEDMNLDRRLVIAMAVALDALQGR